MTRDRRTDTPDDAAEPDTDLETMTDYLIRTGRARPTTMPPPIGPPPIDHPVPVPAPPPAEPELGPEPDPPPGTLLPFEHVDAFAGDRKVRRRRRNPKVPRPRTVVGAQAVQRGAHKVVRGRAHDEYDRPRVRGDCVGAIRPCPWVSCRHHLYLDVNPDTGAIRLTFPDLEPWELKHTCSLDVAEFGGITLEEVGQIVNVSRERIRQVETVSLMKMKFAGVDFEDPVSEPAGNDD